MKKYLFFLIAIKTSMLMAQNGDVLESKTTNYTVLVMYNATNHWLSLSRTERNSFVENQIAPIIKRYDKNLRISFYDAEAFHPETSDFMIINCNNLNDYFFFMEEVRDTKMFTVPYINLTDIVVGIPDGFRKFEDSQSTKNN